MNLFDRDQVKVLSLTDSVFSISTTSYKVEPAIS